MHTHLSFVSHEPRPQGREALICPRMRGGYPCQWRCPPLLGFSSGPPGSCIDTRGCSWWCWRSSRTQPQRGWSSHRYSYPSHLWSWMTNLAKKGHIFLQKSFYLNLLNLILYENNTKQIGFCFVTMCLAANLGLATARVLTDLREYICSEIINGDFNASLYVVKFWL